MKVRTSSGRSQEPRLKLLNAAALRQAKKKSITVQILGVREPPLDWNARCILDIAGFDGYGSMALNATNTKFMVDETGTDESDGWIGRQIQINLGEATYAGRPVDSLVIVNVLAKKALPKRKRNDDDDAPPF